MPLIVTVSSNRLFAHFCSVTKGSLTGNFAANWSADIMTKQIANPWVSQDASEASDAVALNPPTTITPKQGSQHSPGYVILAGKCMRGAAVDILNPDHTVLGKASVNGDNWAFIKKWAVGQHSFKTGQILGGEPSYPSVEQRFTVAIQSDAPLIAAPVDESRHRAGPVSIVVGCDPTASAVRILNYDDSELGVAVKLMPGVWRYDRSWDRGAKHIKAVQVVSGKESSASGMIGFYVE